MSRLLPFVGTDRASCRPPFRPITLIFIGPIVLSVLFSGCSPPPPPATVEGKLRMNGKPLDNCLITFLPESGQNVGVSHSTALTDRSGSFRLRFANQQEGVVTGWHKVTVLDMSVSTGEIRRDHGTVDAELDEMAVPTVVRHSRVPDEYKSPATTPLLRDIKPKHQVVDIDIR